MDDKTRIININEDFFIPELSLDKVRDSLIKEVLNKFVRLS